MRWHCFPVCLAFFLALHAMAASADGSRDTVRTDQTTIGERFIDRAYQVVKKFSQVDTNYIERQHYDYTFMIQSTTTYESYTMGTSDNQVIELSPDLSVKVGPYVGWRWVFLGYTLDLTHVSNGHRKHDVTASFYSNQVGVDLFYRTLGSGFKIRKMKMGHGINTAPMRDVPFNGFEASVKGFNLYYIFNHRRFSYPAAFSQSTNQRRSCGSWLAGFSFTKHDIHFDHDEMARLLRNRVGEHAVVVHDSILSPGKTHYTDISLSAGYAYNWVFAHNWLAAISFSAALGYKRSSGTSLRERISWKDFTVKNYNLDGIGRMAIVWNNTRWYAGMNGVMHTYRYRKSRFSANSVFGNFNLYVGMNFGKRR